MGHLLILKRLRLVPYDVMTTQDTSVISISRSDSDDSLAMTARSSGTTASSLTAKSCSESFFTLLSWRK